MKKIFYKLYASLMMVAFLFAACSPDSNELEAPDVTADDLVEGIAYTITHDGSNPNIVYLESKIGSKYTPVWEHPQGRSQEQKITLKIPFDGTYTVKFGVETRGGIVYGEPVTFTVDDFCADFVTGEMWDFLAGGAGHAKTWVPDNGNYGMKQGFYSCFDPSATYLDMVTDNGTNWYPKDKVWWEPGNGDVGITEDDLNSYMTFSLEGKAGLTVHRFTEGQEAVSEGLFSMNTDNHTMSAVDVDFVHGAWADGKAVDFRNGFQILLLTENQLMIANYRDEALSGEGRCIYCWNFVSKEYADNYVPEPEEPEPTEPVLPDGWKEDVSETVSVITSSTIKWTLSDKNPVDWATQSGKLMNGWTSPSDYPDWLGTLDPAVYEGFSMTLDSKTMKAKFVTPDGTATECGYALDDKGIYTFDGTVPVVTIINWMTFRAGDGGTLRILSIEKGLSDELTGMWVGIPNPDKPDTEYIAYHLIPKAEGSATDDPLAAWKNALTGKTFVPDTNYFADWVAGDWTGGWTSSVFPDDYTSQSWFWTEEISNACKASSLTFYTEGDVLKVDAIDNGVERKGIIVTVDSDEATLTFSEAPLSFTWIYTNNEEGKGPWLFGSYDGANLNNIAAKGMYWGFVSKENEITMTHFVVDK